MTARAPSPAEQAVIDRFGMFDEERVIEEVAQAIRGSNGTPEALASWRRHPQLIPAHVYAAAAVAAYRAAQDGGAEEAYPHASGDVTVIGPECFASADGSVICWRGENFYTAEGKYAADCAALAPQDDA